MKKLCFIAVLAMLITTVCKAQNPGGVPISILPNFTDTLKPNDVLPIVHGGATRRATIAQLSTAIGASGPVGATGAQGATGPTGDSHWTAADSTLYLNDTLYYVGIGTANPQYQLEVHNGFSAVTNNGEIVNSTIGLSGIPYTGIDKIMADGKHGLIGIPNATPLTGEDVDSSAIYFMYSDLAGDQIGGKVIPFTSTTEFFGELVTFHVRNITCGNNIIEPAVYATDNLILSSGECYQDSGALNTILGSFQSACINAGIGVAHQLILAGFGDSTYTYHEMMLGPQAYSNSSPFNGSVMDKRDLLFSIGNSTDANVPDKAVQSSCMQIIKNGNLLIGNHIRYINSPDSAMLTVVGQAGNSAFTVQDSTYAPQFTVTTSGQIIAPHLGTYADDTAAGSGGVPLNGLYEETSTGYIKRRH